MFGERQGEARRVSALQSAVNSSINYGVDCYDIICAGSTKLGTLSSLDVIQYRTENQTRHTVAMKNHSSLSNKIEEGN